MYSTIQLMIIVSSMLKLTNSLPVKKSDDTIHQLFSSLPDSVCKSNVSNIDSEQFESLCGNKKVPANVSEETLSFDFLSSACYTVYHNTRVLCEKKIELNVTKQSNSVEAGNFCESIPKIDINENCTDWLKEPGEGAQEDCVLVSKVVEMIVKDQELCKQHCIVKNKINPVCDSLVRTSLALSNVKTKANHTEVLKSDAADDKNAAANKEVAENVTKPAEVNKNETVQDQDKVVNNTKDSENVIAKPEKIQSQSPKESPEVEVKKDDVKDDSKTDEKKPSADKAAVEDSSESKKDSEKKETEATKEVTKEEDTEIELDEEKMEKNVEEEDNEPTGTEPEDDYTSTHEEVIENKPEPREEVIDNKPVKEKEVSESDHFQGSISGPDVDAESGFFSYFMLLSVVAIIAYLVFHNKQKVTFFLAALEVQMLVCVCVCHTYYNGSKALNFKVFGLKDF